jgi:hypothetical protein
MRMENLGAQRRLFLHVLARTRAIDERLCAEMRHGAAQAGPRELSRKYLTRKNGTLLADAPWNFGVCVARVPRRSSSA